MPKVFVHGNPETAAIWDDLVVELADRGVDDVVRLSPPGFGAPVPDRWGATRTEYAAWLARELHSIGGEIDLVGHDWGAGHVFGVLAAEPTIVRTWASDCAGLLHAEYAWHDAAQAWQTPGVGERAIAGMLSLDPDAFAAVFTSLGMTDAIARAVRLGLDDETGRCVLSLYRSAAQPEMSTLGRAFTAARPGNGVVIIAENDHFAGSSEMHESIAAAVGARVLRIPEAGHWWMIEKPADAADALIAHWSR
ncbi:MAG: alpha/beta hydrolase [Actinobacteria bacterium]|nr:alpha/beta hydrolase [Actinomycetota bacterium]